MTLCAFVESFVILLAKLHIEFARSLLGEH